MQAKVPTLSIRSEFRPEKERRYNRSGTVRWIVSHALRYPQFPLGMLLAAVAQQLFL